MIAINIVNFEAVAVKDFHTVFHLWEDAHRDCLLTDALEIHFIDMKKFKALPDKDIKNNSLHRWLTFFDQNISDDTLKELIDMDTAIYKKRGDVNMFLELYKSLSGKAEREYAEYILEVFTEANEKWIEKWKGEGGMGSALMRIMEPELQEAEKKGREEGIHGTVDILQELGLSREQIKEAVMKRYCLSEKDTAKFL